MRLRSLAALTVLPLVVAALPASAAAPTVAVNRAPYAAVAGPATGLGVVRDIATGADGRTYALLASSIKVFAAGAVGNAAPVRTITFTAGSGEAGWRITVDADGYVTVIVNAGAEHLDESTILVFGPTASGAATPIVDVTNAEIDIQQPLDLADIGDEVAFIDNNRNDVRTYALRDAAVTPTRVIAAGSGTQTQIFSPQAIGSDASGRIAVAGTDWVSMFAAGASGDVAPRVYLKGSRTRLGDYESSIAIAPRGDLVVSAVDYTGVQATGSRVLRFSAGATGNVAPAAVLSGSRTGLGAASSSDLTSAGAIATISLASADFGGNGTRISLHRALGPYAVPGKPKALKVSGTKAAAKRTITWKPPVTNADTPVRGYVVSISCQHRGSGFGRGGSLGAGARSFSIKLGRFRTGRCTAKVQARNVLGTGPVSVLRFAVKR